MTNEIGDIETLAQAFEAFIQSTRTLEEAHRRLQERIGELDQELAGKNRELALSTEYLTNLLESISDGVIAVDPDGIVTRFNRAAAAILGYEAKEVTGRPFKDIFGRDFAAPRIPDDMALRARSGRMVPISERDSPIHDQSGRRIGNVKTFQDLSEIIALREQVRQRDRLAAIGEMAATVAHEIRNPLGGIRGFAAFLARDIPPDDPRARLVDKIQEGTRILDTVVNDLLEYTRPVNLNPTTVACGALLQDVVGFLNHDPARIAVSVAMPPSLHVRADPEKMRQVFMNILINAVQSIRDSGEIAITAQADDHYVAIAFRDTGCGMDAGELERIFWPFYTTKEKGTGLGLAVCRKIVEAHGGDIRADSRPGEGTTITLRLPRVE